MIKMGERVITSKVRKAFEAIVGFLGDMIPISIS